MHNAVVVQIAHRLAQSHEPLLGQLLGKSLGMTVEHDVEGLAGNVFHHNPVIALGIRFHVVKGDQVRMLEVQTLGHAAQLNLLIAAHQFERYFLAAVADSVVDFPEAAAADAALDRVTIQRPLS